MNDESDSKPAATNTLTANRYAHIGLIAANLFFAINISAIKHLTGNGFIKPLALNLVRIGGAVLLFWLLFLLNPSPIEMRKKDWLRLIGCAFCGIALNQILFVTGVSLTLPIHSALLILITPILITVMASVFLREGMTVKKYAGLLMGISGAATLVLFRQQSVAQGSHILLGDLLVAANALVYAVYFIMVKPLMNIYPPIHLIRWVFTLALFMVLPFCWQDFIAVHWETYTIIEYGCLVAVVAGGTFLAYLFNVYGIKVLGPGTAGAYIYTQPVFATAIAVGFSGESIGIYMLIAAVLIFSGVYFVTYKKKKEF